MPTSNVVTSQSGTGFTIDVTAANLLSDTNIKDFVVLHAGSPVSNTLYTKLTPTSLQYVGTSIGTTTIEVRRSTPATNLIIDSPGFIQRFSSATYKDQLDRFLRKFEEAILNGLGPGSLITSPAPLNDAFGIIWDGDTVYPPTRNALYDYLITLASLTSPAFTGNPTAPTQLDMSSNTRLANTLYADTRVANALATSPVLGGNPTAPNQTVIESSTRIANMFMAQILDKGETCNFRLSLTSAIGKDPADRAAQGTLYLTPYTGNRLVLWNGVGWRQYSTAEVSLSLAGLAVGNYDIYAADSGGNIVLNTVAWTNSTTPPSRTVVNGRLTRGSDNTQLLVGAIRISATGVTDDSKLKRLVSNLYNAEERRFLVRDTTASYSYTTASWRQANGATANQVEILNVIERNISAKRVCRVLAGTNSGVWISIGVNSTSDPHNEASEVFANAGTPEFRGSLTSVMEDDTLLGYHTITMLERGDTAATFYGGSTGGGVVNGLMGHIIG